MAMILALFLAICIPLFVLSIIRKFDLYQTGQYNIILLSLVLGGVAYGPAAITNQALYHFGLLGLETIERYFAPISEEIIKGLFLFYLVRHQKFTYSVDGALYGFAVGIGFAVIENYSYIFANQEAALAITLQRIFTTSLVHAFSSAVVGIALGKFRLDTSRFRWRTPVVGLLLAIGQHMLYNNVIHVIDALNTAIPSAITFIPGLPGIFFIRNIMQRSVRQSQAWIMEKLGLDNRITRGEIALVDRLASPDEVLLPIVERFGAEKADQVERLLYLQARLGIKQKALEGILDNDKMRSALETEIREAQAQIDEARHAIGTYVMLFVRGLFTEEMVSVWDQMQAKIQERSAANNDQKGGGLWSSLDERVKS